MEHDEKPHKSDEIYNIDSYNLYLCRKSLLHLIGTKIDYVEDIMGSRFDFNNENIQTKCGCGTSFSMKDMNLFEKYKTYYNKSDTPEISSFIASNLEF